MIVKRTVAENTDPIALFRAVVAEKLAEPVEITGSAE